MSERAPPWDWDVRITGLESLSREDPDEAALSAVGVVRALLRELRGATDMALLGVGPLPNTLLYHNRMRRMRSIVARHTMFDRENPRAPYTAVECDICKLYEKLLELQP